MEGGGRRRGGSIGKKTWHLGLLVILLLAVGVVLFFLRWREGGFEWRLFAATFLEMHPLWMLAAVGFVFASYYARVLRWAVLLRPLKDTPSQWGLFSATVIGFTAIVLFGRPGEVVRPYLIARREGVPFSSQLAALLLERIYDLLTALLIFALALTQVQQSAATVGPGLQWVLRSGGYAASLLSVVCLAILILLRRYSQAMQQRLLDGLSFLPDRYGTRIASFVSAFVEGAGSTKSGSSTILLIVYTLFEWALIAGCYIALFKAFPSTASFSLVDVMIFLGFVSFGCVIQIPGIGGGMQLAALVVLTELFRLPFETSTGLSLIVWITTFVVVVPAGLLLAVREGVTWRKLKELKPEASL